MLRKTTPTKTKYKDLFPSYQWLVCGFHINLDNTLLTVHVVVKQDNLWDLMTISNTNEWKTYITEDLERGRLFSILV
jgi:hypothetical protein